MPTATLTAFLAALMTMGPLPPSQDRRVNVLNANDFQGLRHPKIVAVTNAASQTGDPQLNVQSYSGRIGDKVTGLGYGGGAEDVLQLCSCGTFFRDCIGFQTFRDTVIEPDFRLWDANITKNEEPVSYDPRQGLELGGLRSGGTALVFNATAEPGSPAQTPVLDHEKPSDTAGLRVAALANVYVSHVAEPAALRTQSGEPLDPAFRGYVLTPVKLSDGKRAAVVRDPRTGEVVMGPDGAPLTVTGQPGKDVPKGSTSEVAWRGNSGVRFAIPGGNPEAFMAILRQGIPAINTLRLDINAQTLVNPERREAWQRTAQAAADNGYRLIVVWSEGAFSGGAVPIGLEPGVSRLTLEMIGPADALRRPTNRAWPIAELRDGWAELLRWMAEPENKVLRNSVWGWELINEPMAYGKDAEAGLIYSRHMHDLILDPKLDWGDKRLLVGGLGASTQFQHIDDGLIAEAAGDRLVWSTHIYPQWVAGRLVSAPTLDSLREAGRIPASGDVLITETNLPTAASFLDPWAESRQARAGYAWTRALPNLVDKGIGFTWWPLTSRNSDLITRYKGSFGLRATSVAFAQFAWSRDEAHPIEEPDGRAYVGTGVKDVLDVDSPRGNFSAMTEGFSENFGMLFGYGGGDELRGHQGRDMLYGGSGDDTVKGHGGDDFLFGGPGDDVSDGGDGRDVLFDPEGRNALMGGAEDDLIEGAGQLDGGPGNDTLTASAGVDVTANGGAGHDVFRPGLGARMTITDFDPKTDGLDIVLWRDGRRGAVPVPHRDTDGGTLIDGPEGGRLVLPGVDPEEIDAAQLRVSPKGPDKAGKPQKHTDEAGG